MSAKAELSFPQAIAPAAEARPWVRRSFLIVAFITTMPVTRVFDLVGDNQANLALSDLILPLGALFLLGKLLQSRLRLPVAGLFCLSIGAVGSSILYNLDIYLLARGASGIALEIAKMLSLWLHFYLAVNLVDERRDLTLLLRAWILASVGVAVIGIGGSLAFQLTGTQNPFALDFRAQGTFNDCNLYCAHLSLSFLLTLLYRRLFPPAPGWTLPAMLIQVAGIIFSASRGGLLAFVAALALLWALSSYKVRLVSGVVAAILGLGIMALPEKETWLASNTITARLATATVSLENAEAADRRQLWELALDGFLQSPILGIGRGNFIHLIHAGMASVAHNSYLGILCEVGIVGLAAYLALLAYFAAVLWRSWWRDPERDPRAAAGILLAGLATVSLAGVTISIENYRGLWILLGLSEAFYRLYLSRTV